MDEQQDEEQLVDEVLEIQLIGENSENEKLSSSIIHSQSEFLNKFIV